jgi:hypothetical protein
MGLDFTESEAHWSYSGFMRFRKRIAKQINIDLDSMAGFGGNINWDTVSDPIKPLLDHSDCEGKLTIKECKQIAPRLLEIIKSWPEDYDKNNATVLANDLQICADKNKIMEFC